MIKHTMDGQLTIGISAVGSGIGQAVVDSLRLSNLPLHIVGLEANAWSKGLYECDTGYKLPMISSPHYTDALLKHCQQVGLDLLIPGSDIELPTLAQLAPTLLEQGTQVVISSSACVQLCRDKYVLARYLRDLGLPFVETWSLSEALQLQTELPYPLVIKRLDGSGSLGVQIIYNHGDWLKQHDIDDPDKWIVQPFLMSHKWQGVLREKILNRLQASGYPPQEEEISIQFFVDAEGQIQGRFASVNTLKSGIPVTIDPINEPVMWDSSEAIVKALIDLGLSGPVNLQGRLTPEGPCFFEINPRFTGITHVRALMGYREVEAAVRHFGLKENGTDIQSLLAFRPDQHVGLRQTADIIVARNVMNRFQREGLLTDSFQRHQRILITGITGYLGQAVAEILLGSGLAEEIIAPVRNPSLAMTTFNEALQNRIQFIEWSAPEWPDVGSLQNVDLVIHTAATRSVGNIDIAEWHRFNVMGTAALVSAARAASIPGFIYISSQPVYGTNQPRPWTETASAVYPETPYAYSKAAAEGIVQTLTGSETRWSILRLSRLYGLGTGMRWSELPHHFLALARSGDPLLIHGNGNQEMDLLNISDAAECVIKLVGAPRKAWNEIYNVGSGAPVSVNDLARTCIELVQHRTGVHSSVQHTTQTQDSKSFGMSIDHIYAKTGWSPKVDLYSGLAQVLDYLDK